MPTIIPVILSGGSGTRLWPLSRAMYPKQFIRFNGQTESFLGATLRRLSADKGFDKPVILCNNDHRFLVKAELEQARIETSAIILEPVARNTAPAIAVAALNAVAVDPNAIIVVMPSDHDMASPAGVRRRRAARRSRRRHRPAGAVRHPAGIGRTPATATSAPAPTSMASRARPSRSMPSPKSRTRRRPRNTSPPAATSGTAASSCCTPARSSTSSRSTRPPCSPPPATPSPRSTVDLGFRRLDKDAFEQAPNISIDYAVMEKTKAAAMLPIDVGWNDVGSWSSLWDIAPQ